MPKRFFILVYTFLFALLQLGMTVEVHYCGKKTSYNVLGIEIGKKCPCPSDHHQHHNGCCHDEEVVLKADTDEVTVPTFYLAKTDLIALPAILSADFIPFILPTHDFTFLFTDAPPGNPGKIFLRHQVLLL